MKTPADLLHDAHYAFAFRTLEPAPQEARMLLVLLHGVGGDELQLADVGARMPDGVLVALPRGPRTISGERLGWFREGLSEDGPQVVEDEAEDARGRLLEFLGQLQHRHAIPASHTIVAGFSQGGMLAAAAALTSPQSVAGFAMLCGRVMPELEPDLAPAEALASLHALIVHGRDDDVLPLEWAERAAGRLRALGVAHELRLHDAGHALEPAMEDDLLHWLTAGPRPWHDPAQRRSGSRMS
jgi:phospholipase/carboxylesterase